MKPADGFEPLAELLDEETDIGDGNRVRAVHDAARLHARDARDQGKTIAHAMMGFGNERIVRRRGSVRLGLVRNGHIVVH